MKFFDMVTDAAFIVAVLVMIFAVAMLGVLVLSTVFPL